ncbi:MAG: 4a-hydroxytetrahydrobiopterin dehydratase [Granulosicoccaceae bacterium]|jgi:4a-hydroxytetrahydrobiopterin dehydratase
MTQLLDMHCTRNPPALGDRDIAAYLAQLDGWQHRSESAQICREFRFKNYYETIAFVNAVAWIANNEDHHPDMQVTYNRCTVCYTTHSVNNLSINDFVCAAKIDVLLHSAD